MQIRRVEIFVGILLAVIATATGLRCYSCSSYMNQCKEVVSRSPSHVGRNKCTTKCFVRTGEDGATYRGCFDDFSRVVHLQANYIGCRNQTWNNRSLRWCFCSTELCNGAGMDTLETMTESGPAAAAEAKEQQPVLPTHTITTPPAMLNTDHGVFKYVEEEKEGAEEEEQVTSRPSSAEVRGPTKTQLRSNAVPTKAKLNRAALKQSNGEDQLYYERIDKPIEEVYGSARTAVEQAHHGGGLRHGVNSAHKGARPNGPLQGAIVVEKPNEEIFDREYELNDLDYPYNQDMRSISRIVEKLSKVENAHQFGQGSFRSSGDDVKVLSIRKGGDGPKLNQSPDRRVVDLQLKSGKVKSRYEEPLPFTSHVSAELAAKMTCEESGYYQHPSDCTLYMACVYVPYTHSPIWHLMRCPELLFWDNERKICVEFSINCPKVEGVDKPPIHKFI